MQIGDLVKKVWVCKGIDRQRDTDDVGLIVAIGDIYANSIGDLNSLVVVHWQKSSKRKHEYPEDLIICK